MPGLKDIARQAGIRFSDAQAIFEAILARVAHGERVMVSGFGVFYQGKTRATTIRSPVLAKLGKDNMKIPAYHKLRFRPSKMTRMIAEKEKHGAAKGTR